MVKDSPTWFIVFKLISRTGSLYFLRGGFYLCFYIYKICKFYKNKKTTCGDKWFFMVAPAFCVRRDDKKVL